MIRRLLGSEARVFETVSALGNVLWGLWLFLPQIDFDRAAYQILAKIAHHHVWGGAIFALGAAHAYALYADSKAARRWLSLLQAFVWIVIAIGLGGKNFYSTAFPTYAWIAALHIAVWFRLAVIR